MREATQVFSGCIIMIAMVAHCFAGDDMAERASRLISALNIQTNTESLAASRPVFSGSTTMKAGDFQMKQKKATRDQSVSVEDVEVLGKEGQATATGRIIECGSASAARKALVAELVQNSMPLDLLIRKYELRRNEIGDFCIVEKVYDKATGMTSVDQSVLHFVRDGKAVSLYAREKGVDVRPVAKAVDAVMCEASETTKPSNKK